jgi:hypothetical protein
VRQVVKLLLVDWLGAEGFRQAGSDLVAIPRRVRKVQAMTNHDVAGVVAKDGVYWLRDLAAKGGIVVNNIEARCLGQIADLIESQAKALSEYEVAYDGLMKAKETFRAEAHRNAARALAFEARLAGATRLLTRYRDETPLGNQPHMMAHEAAAFALALANQES